MLMSLYLHLCLSTLIFGAVLFCRKYLVVYLFILRSVDYPKVAGMLFPERHPAVEFFKHHKRNSFNISCTEMAEETETDIQKLGT